MTPACQSPFHRLLSGCLTLSTLQVTLPGVLSRTPSTAMKSWTIIRDSGTVVVEGATAPPPSMGGLKVNVQTRRELPWGLSTATPHGLELCYSALLHTLPLSSTTFPRICIVLCCVDCIVLYLLYYTDRIVLYCIDCIDCIVLTVLYCIDCTVLYWLYCIDVLYWLYYTILIVLYCIELIVLYCIYRIVSYHIVSYFTSSVLPSSGGTPLQCPRQSHTFHLISSVRSMCSGRQESKHKSVWQRGDWNRSIKQGVGERRVREGRQGGIANTKSHWRGHMEAHHCGSVSQTIHIQTKPKWRHQITGRHLST